MIQGGKNYECCRGDDALIRGRERDQCADDYTRKTPKPLAEKKRRADYCKFL